MGAPRWPPNPQRSDRPGEAGAALHDPRDPRLTWGPRQSPHTPTARTPPPKPPRPPTTRTGPLGLTRGLRRRARLGAPVWGRLISVGQGGAWVAVGGGRDALERVRPYLAAMAPGGITHVGPLGLAKTMKIATNLGLAVQMLAFAEAVLLAEKAGIAREMAVEALLKSVIASPMVEYRGPYVVGSME